MKLLSVAVVTLAAATAFAAKSNTEYFYQPAGGQQAVEIHYEMNAKPAKTESGGTESDNKSTTSDFELAYWYGLSEGNAIGVQTFFGSKKTEVTGSSSTASGMGDIFLGYKGFTDMWHYGVDLGINTAKIKVNSSSEVENRASGGLSLIPYVGMLMSSDALNYGAKLTYAHYMERSVDNSVNTKITGGADITLAPFIEYNYGMGFVGAELAYHMVGDSTQKSDGAADTKYKGESFPMINLNGSYDFNDMVTGLASLGFGMHPEHDETDSAGSAKVKAYTETNVNLGVRLTF